MNNKRGTFLVVMSIATVIIAGIGATFAYFSATVTDNTPVQVESYKFATTLSINEVLPSAEGTQPTNNLIPLADADLSDAMAQNCVDDDGYLVCKVYELNFSNAGVAITLNGQLEVIENTGFTNLKIQMLDETGAFIDGSTAATVPAFTEDPHAIAGLTFASGSSTFILADGTTSPFEQTYRIVVWLSNQDTEQKEEQDKTFTGNLVFNSADGGRLVGKIGLS